ncbi:protein kinase, partial [Myxococcota bacterium]|nr:protein kinase [Myxococcota bacterium]
MSVGAEDSLPADFGKYRLVRRIATGGMAEIFLAHRHDTPDDPIVIKRILPHLIKSAEFVSMFLDEARIAAQLQHPNVVRIDDIGQINGAYYIAMEYVHGEDIRRIYNSAYKLQRSLPLSHSIRVIAEAASGLAYAHKLTDFAGRPMGVVHRDVSPQNILVTYEGGVKVVDFGIAKAANKVNQTRAGVLKGKYSYMSPEQALGDNIDHRTDIFALGIILYETTTGTRLFKRHNELATLQAIIKCEIMPPAEALPGYPDDLERVLLRALAKDPDDRYSDAQDFSEALFEFLHTSGLYVGPEAIAEFMRDLFKDRLEEEEAIGAPALPHEEVHREELRATDTPMKASSRSSRAGVVEASTAEPSVEQRQPSAQLRAEAAADPLVGFRDLPEPDADPEPTGTEADLDELRALGLDIPPRVEDTSPSQPMYRALARGVDPAALRSADIPATLLSAKNRQRTEAMRPGADVPATNVERAVDPASLASSERIPKVERSSPREATTAERGSAPRSLRPGERAPASEPGLRADTLAEGSRAATAIDDTSEEAPASVLGLDDERTDDGEHLVTTAEAPPDLAPTIAAQPAYGSLPPLGPAVVPKARTPTPERSNVQLPQEPTEQVRARAQAARRPAEDRARDAERAGRDASDRDGRDRDGATRDARDRDGRDRDGATRDVRERDGRGSRDRDARERDGRDAKAEAREGRGG